MINFIRNLLGLNSVDNILSSFNSAINNLLAGADYQRGQANIKFSLIAKLEAQAENHATEAVKAEKAAKKLRAFVNLEETV